MTVQIFMRLVLKVLKVTQRAPPVRPCISIVYDPFASYEPGGREFESLRARQKTRGYLGNPFLFAPKSESSTHFLRVSIKGVIGECDARVVGVLTKVVQLVTRHYCWKVVLPPGGDLCEFLSPGA